MSWRNIKLIFRRELGDQLRDRRTLFMVTILPLMLYPALGMGMLEMMLTAQHKQRTIVILGSAHLPTEPELLDASGIRAEWFRMRQQDVDSLKVLTDNPAVESQLDDPERERRNRVLLDAQLIHDAFERKRQELLPSDGGNDKPSDDSETEDRTRRHLGDKLTASGIQVLVIVPDGFADNLRRVDKALARRANLTDDLANYPRPIIIQNTADERSLFAYRRIRDALDKWERAILKQRLSAANLPDSVHTPVGPIRVDLAVQDQIAASIWSKMFPALLVIMAVTGAFYPAIDLGAGEKERGTMETLLICPATRFEIVIGKFLTVMLFSMATVVLNLLSMGLTGKYLLPVFSKGPAAALDLSLPPITSLAWVLVLMVPLAALFSALCLALATFARSSKEGQHYLTPLLMVVLGLTVFCLFPEQEISPLYSTIPVVNLALLLKGLLLAPLNASPLYGYIIPVLVSSVCYSLLAIWWAVEQFSNEEVLFREAERFDLKLWIRHVLREKEPLPSFTEAALCFGLIMVLQFAAMNHMAPDLSASNPGGQMLHLLLVQQVVIIACPAIFMGLILTTSVRRTFRAYFPEVSFVAAAVALPFVLHPLSVELGAALEGWFFPELPKGFEKVMAVLGDDSLPLWLVLTAFALAPAVCEEFAFRGFILSGFARSHKRGTAVVLSSLAFGFMHLIPQQVFNATLVGLVIGLIAIRSGSLLPCVLFHFIYNALGVLHGRFGARIATDGIAGWLFRNEGGVLRYNSAMLCLAAVAAGILLRWLLVCNDSRLVPRSTKSGDKRQLASQGLPG